MELVDLPDDVLHIIFSYLPLKTVLQMECICKRLQSSTLFYLFTLKSIDPFSHSFQEDLFREWNDERKLTPSQLLHCLKRCSRATRITYIPGPSNASDAAYCKEVCQYVKQFPNITDVNFLDNQKLLEEFIAQKVQVRFGEVYMALHCNSIISGQLNPSPFKHTGVLHVEDIQLSPLVFKQFLSCTEMTFVRCLLTVDNNDILKDLSLPNIKKFVYVEEPGNPASSQIFSKIINVAIQNEELRILHLGLNRFSILDGVAANWLADNVEDFEITSTGSSYSTALQQLRYAPVVAGICQKSRGSLQRMCLPSTIVVKQFFELLVSRGCAFPHLKTFETTGIADTKMFLVPGQAVEALYYQEFIKLCPQIKNLSLNSFSGSLSSLSTPITICSIVLPWDNRLDFEKQKNDIEECVSFLPNLSSLTIFGVEEVEALLERTHTSKGSLVFSSESLLQFRIKNASLKKLDLADCSNLSLFSMHCCPTIVSLPTESLHSIRIYTDDYEKLEKFITDFLLVKSKIKKQNDVTCHIHAQLHCISEYEEGIVPAPHEVKMSQQFKVLQQAIVNLSRNLNFWVFIDKASHEFEHNSGEPMYPFTEYTSPSSIASARSKTEILMETSHRDRILEGIRRWTTCISHVKLISPPSSLSESCDEVFAFDTRFCARKFRCITNLKYLPLLNADNTVCQASGNVLCHGFDDEVTSLAVDIETNEDSVVYDKGMHGMHSLNVPRIIAPPMQQITTSPLFSYTNNSLVFISVVEYSHCIRRLFYYD